VARVSGSEMVVVEEQWSEIRIQTLGECAVGWLVRMLD
jgi:hypothetical protein